MSLRGVPKGRRGNDTKFVGRGHDPAANVNPFDLPVWPVNVHITVSPAKNSSLPDRRGRDRALQSGKKELHPFGWSFMFALPNLSFTAYP